MVDVSVIGAVGNFSQAAILTFAIPIATLALSIGLGFYHRKPLPDTRRVPLFPLSGIPQRTYDLSLLAALSERDRAELVTAHEEAEPGASRPVGGA